MTTHSYANLQPFSYVEKFTVAELLPVIALLLPFGPPLAAAAATTSQHR